MGTAPRWIAGFLMNLKRESSIGKARAGCQTCTQTCCLRAFRSARELRFDLGESARDFARRDRNAELPGDLSRGEQAAHRLAPAASCSTTTACWRPARFSVATMCPTFAARTSFRSSTSSRSWGVMMSRTSSSSRRMPRCVITCIGFSPRMSRRRDDADDLPVLVDDQQQPHAALDHAPVRLIDAVAGQNDDRSHRPEIGHHAQGGIFEPYPLRNRLRGLRVADAGMPAARP